MTRTCVSSTFQTATASLVLWRLLHLNMVSRALSTTGYSSMAMRLGRIPLAHRREGVEVIERRMLSGDNGRVYGETRRRFVGLAIRRRASSGDNHNSSLSQRIVVLSLGIFHYCHRLNAIVCFNPTSFSPSPRPLWSTLVAIPRRQGTKYAS